MAEILTYDPSDDPQAVQSAQARDAENLAVAEQLEREQSQLLAGKYKDAQELEKAYLELQTKLGGDTQEEEEVEEGEEVVDETEPGSDEALEFFEALNDEYDENGSLSEESLEALKEMSSEELVDAYFQMQDRLGSETDSVELSESDVTSIQQSVGGADNYNALVSWAAENFDQSEIEAFDGVVESGNVGAINLALQALYYRYTEAEGMEGQLLQGKAAAPANGFRSQAEVVRAMQDPRYDRDPAYRAEVMQRLEQSDLDF
jgi:high-affinity Fe2+/Pb2+ permease|tara:strand:+ start:13869 stop:14651 length:783 start_codon:yes stop_codon:yes gene_type:complete